MRLAVLALTLSGCLGPLLPLPRQPHLAHEWLCVNRACPRDAEPLGGLVRGARYDSRTRLCDCSIEDSRHLPQFTHPDPHR